MLSRLLLVTAAFVFLATASTSYLVATEPGETNILPELPRSASVTQGKAMCRLPSIFHCRPEPLYCHPEPVCITKICPPAPRYCHPEPVCKYPICRPEPWLCRPEIVCSDPEPRCCNEPEWGTGKALIKAR